MADGSKIVSLNGIYCERPFPSVQMDEKNLG